MKICTVSWFLEERQDWGGHEKVSQSETMRQRNREFPSTSPDTSGQRHRAESQSRRHAGVFWEAKPLRSGSVWTRVKNHHLPVDKGCVCMAGKGPVAGKGCHRSEPCSKRNIGQWSERLSHMWLLQQPGQTFPSNTGSKAVPPVPNSNACEVCLLICFRMHSGWPV